MALTKEELAHILNYNPDTGNFVWLSPTSKRVKVGSMAGCIDTQTGYRKLRINGRMYYAHRLAWLYTHGCWPTGVIDHINRSKGDNRIDNLRDVSHSDNSSNNSARGYIQNICGNFTAYIQKHSVKTCLGTYKTEEEARMAYLNERGNLFK